jgi:hypothetical protein
VTLPLHKLLNKDILYKKAWIANAESFVAANRMAIRRSRRILRGMKKCLWRWLVTGHKWKKNKKRKGGRGMWYIDDVPDRL